MRANEDRLWLSGLKVVVDLSKDVTRDVQSAPDGIEPLAVSRVQQRSADAENQRVP